MLHRAGPVGRRGVVVFGVLALLAPTAAVAQAGADGFLFKRPTLSIGIRAGYDVRRADGALFDYVRDTYTVAQRDLDGGTVGGELAFRATDRLDLVLGLGYSLGYVWSEYWDWVDQDELPIEQENVLNTVPVTLSARYYLSSRGRSIGRFAWVPARVAPYVGGGVGVVWYRFTQSGDFVNDATLEIYPDRLLEEGSTFGVHGLAGFDVSLNQALMLNTEARMTLANGAVDGYAYGRNFDKIDLAGLQIMVGLGVRF